MCCLFGLMDYRHKLPLRDRQSMLHALSVAAEERGTDATGIAYFTHGRLYIQKAPRAAHRMHLRIASDAYCVMGHTRMTTQGNEKKNYNNHPFRGKAGRMPFALAHNGMLQNDKNLRASHRLPATPIETDSYIAVQLIEKDRIVDFGSLKHMAEALRGSFTITVLDAQNSLYFIMGNNPMCIYHFENGGFYLYASTKAILEKALAWAHLNAGPHTEIQIDSGEILRIAANGVCTLDAFDDSALWTFPIYSLYGWPGPNAQTDAKGTNCTDTLKLYSQISGYDCNTLTCLYAAGYSLLEIEQMIYDPAFMDECLTEVLYG